MATKVDDKETVSQQDLLIAQMVQIDAVTQLLTGKSIFTEQGFFTKLKQVQAEYQNRARRT